MDCRKTEFKNRKPLVQGLVLKYRSEAQAMKIEEAPRAGAGIEILMMSGRRTRRNEAPRAGAGIEIQWLSSSRMIAGEAPRAGAGIEIR